MCVEGAHNRFSLDRKTTDHESTLLGSQGRIKHWPESLYINQFRSPALYIQRFTPSEIHAIATSAKQIDRTWTLFGVIATHPMSRPELEHRELTLQRGGLGELFC